MTSENGARERLRIYVTGDCDGLDALATRSTPIPTSSSSAPATRSPRPRPRSPAGTSTRSCTARGSTLPAGEIAAIREQTRTPVSSPPRRGLVPARQALDADVADVLLLPQLTENVVFAIRKAAHARRYVQASGNGRPSAAGSSPSSRRRAAPARP